MYMCLHIRTHKLVRHSLTHHPFHITQASKNAHLIGVFHIGASLQQDSQTGRECKACTTKQERVLVVVRNDGVLRERCLHLGLAREHNRCFALLREAGREHVRWVCSSMYIVQPRCARAPCLHVLRTRLLHERTPACMCRSIRANVYSKFVCVYISVQYIYIYIYIYICLYNASCICTCPYLVSKRGIRAE